MPCFVGQPRAVCVLPKRAAVSSRNLETKARPYLRESNAQTKEKKCGLWRLCLYGAVGGDENANEIGNENWNENANENANVVLDAGPDERCATATRGRRRHRPGACEDPQSFEREAGPGPVGTELGRWNRYAENQKAGASFVYSSFPKKKKSRTKSPVEHGDMLEQKSVTIQ